MMHDFARSHSRQPVPVQKPAKIPALLAIAGLLLIAVGAKHINQRTEKLDQQLDLAALNQTAEQIQPAPTAKVNSATNVNSAINTANAKSQKATVASNKQTAAQREASNVASDPVEDELTPSLLKKLVGHGHANGSGFEFYDMLKLAWPKANEVVIEVNDGSNNERSFLQVASYREEDDADKMRRKLSAMGLESSIETGASDSGTRWYRVFVGPFSSEAKLKRIENTLLKMNLAPIAVNR